METVVVGTAGHIDHGKSALVRALTGIDPDRLKEEQARGITIDLGFAHADLGDVQVAFVDVPGHERFVRNMLAGAGGIDAVMLVVAATESVKPQTREHFEICRLLGVNRGLVVLSKADVADADLLARAEADVRELVAESFLTGAPIIPVSALTGQGLPELRAALAATAGRPSRRHRAGVVRLPVDRVFTVKGFGAVVTGTLVSGAIAVGDTLTLLPQGRVVRVRGLQVHGTAATRVAASQRVAVNLAGVAAAQIARGMTLATPEALAVTSRADVRLQTLAQTRSLEHGARVRVHQGTTETFARVSVAATRDNSAGAWKPARAGDVRIEVAPGGEALARLRFERPVVLTRGDRFVVRAASPVVTIGGGLVLDPEPPARGLRRDAAFDRFRQLDAADDSGVVQSLLIEVGAQGLDADSVVRRAGVDPLEANAMLDRLVADSLATTAGERVFAASVTREVGRQVESELRRFHAEHPEESGMPRETLRERLGPRTRGELFDSVLSTFIAGGVVRGADRVTLVTHQPTVPSGDLRTREAVETRLRAAALAPPDAPVMAAELGVPVDVIVRAIQSLVRDGRLVRSGDVTFHRDALVALKADIAAQRADQPPADRVTLDVAAFKARHGLTRKHAIPLLEWLDRERVTRRVGDVRVVL